MSETDDLVDTVSHHRTLLTLKSKHAIEHQDQNDDDISLRYRSKRIMIEEEKYRRSEHGSIEIGPHFAAALSIISLYPLSRSLIGLFTHISQSRLPQEQTKTARQR